MLLLEYGGCFVFHILVASYQLYDESGEKKKRRLRTFVCSGHVLL